MIAPDGYDSIQIGRSEAFARPAASDWVGSVLAAGSTLQRWAAEQPDARVLLGRGDVFVVRPPGIGDAEGWVVRHYHRGGLLRHLNRDRYWMSRPTRPFLELEVSLEARARGVRTPEVIAGAIYPPGRIYRADLVTELVTDARPLSEIVFGPSPAGPPAAASDPPELGEALRLAGDLVRRLEEARIRHPDLNAGNVLVRRGAAGASAYVVDLDRCEVVARVAYARGMMRRRLERSLRKLERRSGRTLSAADWGALRAGYREGS